MIDNKSCSNCRHWEQQKPYTWGICVYTLPWWVENESPIIHHDKNSANDCETYEINDDK